MTNTAGENKSLMDTSTQTRTRIRAWRVDAARLEAVLAETERDMLQVFGQIGFGKYWWCYFLLTAPWRLFRRGRTE